MKKKSLLQTEEELVRFEPNLDCGLSSEQVNLRISQNKTNAVKNNISKTYWQIIRGNVCTFFNLLCIICFVALLSVNAPLSNYMFAVIFGANMIIGIFQEIKAKKTVERLSLVKSPTAKVLRNGETIEIPVSSIVLDDIIYLSLGEQIPADCIILDGEVEANESLITGESVAIKKVKGDFLLSGSFLSSGSCLAQAVKVGEEAYVQTLSKKAKKYKRANSELLNSLNKLIKMIGILLFPIAFVTAIVNYNLTFGNVPEIILKTSAVVIGMIPSGMFLLTTLALAVGIIKLSNVNTRVQDMYSLEMLARVNVLCLDKTGTITDGNMVVTNVIELEKLAHPIETIISSMQKALADNNQTANALNDYFKSENVLTATAKIPFSSKRKYSAVCLDGLTYALGAPEFLNVELSQDNIKTIENEQNLGRRVILLASTKDGIEDDEVKGTLTPLCLISIEENVRKEAIETIKWFKENDVSVRVISGDNPLTVSIIAKRAGVLGAENYVSLHDKTDEEVYALANEYTVFGRVSPEQKAILIKAIKDGGKTVAMTGDGVNDILAMKEADCSITVAGGSSATRSLAHIVLLDDNFNTIPQAVKEGRRVINNIQLSSSLYLMKTLFTIVFALISIITWSQYPFTTGKMLMLEFFIIGVPSFALSFQPNDKRVSGRFIPYVLSCCIPGALALILNVLFAGHANIFGVQTAGGVQESLEALALTFAGLSYLAVICFPYNKYRGALVGLVSLVLIVWASFLMNFSIFGKSFFDMYQLTFANNLDAILFMVVMIVLDFPLIIFARKFAQKLAQKFA